MQTAQKQLYPGTVVATVRRLIARAQAILVVLALVLTLVASITGVFLYTRGRAMAASASTLNFQARLLSASGSVVNDGSYNIEFNLYSVSSGGSSLWTEDWLVNASQGVTVKNGFLSTSLGSLTAFPNTIPWDQDLYLGMTVRGTTSCAWGACTPADTEMTPRFKLTAVPYAFRAAKLMDSTNTNAFNADQLAQLAPGAPQVINAAAAALRLNQTGSGGLLQLQSGGADTLTVSNTGAVLSKNTTDSTAAFEVQNHSGGSLLKIDTQANSATLGSATGTGQTILQSGSGGVQILSSGNVSVGTADGTGTLLVLDTKNTSGDPTGVDGAMYYNSAMARFRCYQNGSWADCVGGAASSTLQGDYTNSTAPATVLTTDNKDLLFNLANTTTDSNFLVNIQTGSTSKFAVQNNGSDVFNVNSTGMSVAGTAALNGNTTVGDATTDRLTVTSQVLGGNALVFQGATDDAYATTLAIADPTNTRTITLPNASGTVAVSASGNIALDSAGNLTLTSQVPIANGGTGAATAQAAINAIAGLTTNGDLLYYNGSDAVRLARGGNGQCLTSNTTSLVWGSCTAGAVTSVGAVGSPTANGASITGSVLNLAEADGTNPGLLSAGGQTIGGIKTFNSNIVAPTSTNTINGLVINGGALSSVTGITTNGGYTQSGSTANTFTGLINANGGITFGASQTLTINGDALTDLTGTGLTNSSGALSVAYGSGTGSAVQGSTTLVCASGSGNLTGGGTTITLGSGGTCGAISTNNAVTFSTSVTTPTITNTAGLSLSSGGTSTITLNSANNILTIDSTDTTLQRTAAGTYTIDLADTAATTLTLTNSGTGVADLNLAEGSLVTAGTSRLTNGGALQNITGLAVAGTTTINTTGSATTTIANSGSTVAINGATTIGANLNANGNTTIGDATTDRLTITSQLLGANALVFQGATDNASATTFAITDPTASNTVTVPNDSGLLALIGPSGAQTDTSTNSSLYIDKTGASGNLVTLSDSGSSVFTIGNTGDVLIKPSALSTAALQVQDTSNNAILTTNTNGKVVMVGASATDAVQVLFKVDSFSTYADTATCDATTNQGAMYYNTATGSMRGCINGSWEDMISTQGLGLLMFGVVPDSSNATSPGDIGGITGLTNGPCSVTWSGTSQVTVNPCIAYSGGRKVIVASTNISTSALANNAYANICLTGAGGQPALGASNTTETSAGLPTFSINNPVLCLATVKVANPGGSVTNIWDTRTFTTTQKEFTTINTVNSPGYIVVADTTNANRTIATATNSAGGIRGVVVATSGAASTNTINAIIAVAGHQYFKITAGGTAAVGSVVQTVNTAGYGRTAATFTSSYSSLGILQKGIDTSCTAATNCQYSGLTDISISR